MKFSFTAVKLFSCQNHFTKLTKLFRRKLDETQQPIQPREIQSSSTFWRVFRINFVLCKPFENLKNEILVENERIPSIFRTMKKKHTKKVCEFQFVFSFASHLCLSFTFRNRSEAPRHVPIQNGLKYLSVFDEFKSQQTKNWVENFL